MTKSGKLARRRDIQHDDIFESLRREIQDALRPWQAGFGLSKVFENARVPLCDIADRGKEYELHLEVPGIEKDKISLKATGNSLEVSAEQSQKKEEKGKGYIHRERSHSAFYRRIPFPQEVVASKIDARVNNGLLVVRIPKKKSPKAGTKATKVEVK